MLNLFWREICISFRFCDSSVLKLQKMSKFTVDLKENQPAPIAAAQEKTSPNFGEYQNPQKKSRFLKILGVLGIALAAILIIVGIVGFFYYQSLKKSPQYSLALLVDAARNGDQKTIDELVDTDAVVDDFMPQITDKAIELYGRGLPPATVQRVTQIAAPFVPQMKKQARQVVPLLIKDKTQSFESVPFWAIVLGAGRILDISESGDKAVLKSNIKNRQTEITMRKSGSRWKIVGVKDEQLAQRVAEKIGQQIIAAASGKTGANDAGRQFGVENLPDLLNQFRDILQQ